MKSFASLALATALLVAGSSFANAYTRTGGGTGPRGNSYTSHGSGSCSGGTCKSKQSVTGPNGNSASRSNQATCSGGSCTTKHTVTGPAGNQATRGNTFSQ